MQNNMQIWLESSTTTFNLNSHEDGVYLISDLDGLTSLPSIRTSAGVNAGTDGGWTSAQAFDARLISVRVVITNEDVSVVETKRRQLNSLLAQSRKETLKLHFLSEGGMEYVINVRITNVTGALTNILKKQELLIQMRADDPIIYGSHGGGSADATLNVQQAIGGFEIPFDIPLIIDGGTDKVNVENLGSEEVYPTIKMTGPLHNPTVVNETQDAEIGVNADLGDMEWQGYESLQLLGNASQFTTTGKNLLNETTIDRTITSGSAISVSVPITVSAGDYSFGAFANGTFCSESNYYSFSFRNGQTTVVGSANPNQPITVSSAQASQIDNILCYFNTTFTGAYNGKQLTAMVCSGSTLGAYEPYTAGASPNPDYPQPVEVVTGRQEVKITGKNLLCLDDVPITTSVFTPEKSTNEVKLTTLTATGNYQNANFSLPLADMGLKAGDTITVSMDISGTYTGENGATVRLYYDNTSGAWIARLNTSTPSATLTIPEGKTSLLFYMYARYGATPAIGSTATFGNIMLERNASPTAYEPYQSQSYEINLGKNLLTLDGITPTGNQYITYTQLDSNSLKLTALSGIGAYSDKTFTYSMEELGLHAGDTVSIQMDMTGDYASRQCRVYYNSISTLATTLTPASNKKTITIPSGTTSILFLFYVANAETPSANSTATYSNIMVEKSATPTSYAPYKTPIELAKIGTYQDYIWNDNGTWKIHKEVGKVVFKGDKVSGAGDPSKDQANAESALFYCGAITDAYSDNPQYFSMTISDHLIAKNVYNSTHTENGYYIAAGNKTLAIRVRGDVIGSTMSVSDFKTWFSNNPTNIYYTLATPIDTEITDSELVAQLNALLKTSPYYGTDQNIFLIPSGGAQGTLIIGDHIPPKPADEVLIDTQLKTVTLNGQNIYHLLKEGSSFFTLAPGDNSMYLTSDVSSDTGKAEIKFKQGFVSI